MGRKTIRRRESVQAEKLRNVQSARHGTRVGSDIPAEGQYISCITESANVKQYGSKSTCSLINCLFRSVSHSLYHQCSTVIGGFFLSPLSRTQNVAAHVLLAVDPKDKHAHVC